jgi:hypothetical protein
VCEHTFASVPAVGDSVDDIIRIASLTMSEDQADRLIGWIALRTGRSKALATGDDTLTRLRHVSCNWLDDDQRRQLAGWIARKVALGEDPVPASPAAIRRAGGGSGTLRT